MLELNKEYTYKQIIELLGWEEKAGNSKKAQIKEIESCFEFYHPMNKKTHKEKKSYIFTKQLREPVEPSKSNCGGSHNTKNIKPMIEYLQGYLSDGLFGEYQSMTTWYCEILDLLDKELCTTVYQGEDAINAYCNKHNIHNSKLLCDYVSTAKSVLKDILLKALKNMEKNKLCTYYDGYIFIYDMGNRYGYIMTDGINDIIIGNETTVCNDLKEEHNLSDKLKGRQLLMQIYNRKDLTEAFDEFKVLGLMDSDEAIDLLNKELDFAHGEEHCTHIDDEHPLVNYYHGVCVSDMELVDADTDALAKDICTIIRNKTRKAMYSKGGKNSRGEKYYIYNEFKHSAEMDNIEQLLFVPCISPINALTDDAITKGYTGEDFLDQIKDEDIFEQFDFLQSSNNFNSATDDWGEQIDFSVEEMLDMPTMGEVQPHLAKKGSVANRYLCSEGDYPTMDSDVLSQEEAWELFA